MASPKNSSKATASTTKIQFHYIKSSQHRVVYCDGVVGSITPQGKIFASLYNERIPVPKSATHEVDKDGTVSTSPVEIDGRTGIVRELEVGVCLDRNTAEKLRDWLTSQINEYDKFVTIFHNKKS